MNQMRKYALAYLARKINLEDFLSWLADATSPVVDLGLNPHEKSLAGEIELRAAELTGGHLSEERFRVLLNAIISDTCVTYVSADLLRSDSWETASEAVSVRVERLAVSV